MTDLPALFGQIDIYLFDQLLRGRIPPGARICDAGCGSGVLSIAAAKLGFGPVHAVDVDPQAIESTARNAAANGVRVDTRLADAVRDPLPSTRAAVVNVALEVDGPIVGRLECEHLVISGYLASELPELDGYRRADPPGSMDGLLTPPSTLAALAAGYRPVLHPTAFD